VSQKAKFLVCMESITTSFKGPALASSSDIQLLPTAPAQAFKGMEQALLYVTCSPGSVLEIATSQG